MSAFFLPLIFKVSVCIDSDKSRIKYSSRIQQNDICINIVQLRLFCCKCSMHGKHEWFSRKPVHVLGNHSFQSRMQASQRCRKCSNSMSVLPYLDPRTFTVRGCKFKNWGRFQRSDDFAEGIYSILWSDHLGCLGCWANTCLHPDDFAEDFSAFWWLDHFLPEQVGMAENKGKGWRHRIGMMTYYPQY